MIRMGLNKGENFVLLILTLFVTLSCSKGYNRHADEYYSQGKIFYENMDYERSIDSFSKVLELAPVRGGEQSGLLYARAILLQKSTV